MLLRLTMCCLSCLRMHLCIAYNTNLAGHWPFLVCDYDSSAMAGVQSTSKHGARLVIHRTIANMSHLLRRLAGCVCPQAEGRLCLQAEYSNPVKQDVNKAYELRHYHSPMPWNYGMLPQTWEDPAASSSILPGIGV